MADNIKTFYILGWIGIFFAFVQLVVHTAMSVIVSIALGSELGEITQLQDALARLTLVPPFFSAFTVISSIASGIVDIRRITFAEPRNETRIIVSYLYSYIYS